ncbi:hypothetical protein KDL45_00800 [bacterium]|nr:hypothetical protein [bacterium]
MLKLVQQSRWRTNPIREQGRDDHSQICSWVGYFRLTRVVLGRAELPGRPLRHQGLVQPSGFDNALRRIGVGRPTAVPIYFLISQSDRRRAEDFRNSVSSPAGARPRTNFPVIPSDEFSAPLIFHR